MKYKIVAKIFISSMLIMLLSAIVSGYKIELNSFLRFISFFYLTCYFFRVHKKSTNELNLLIIFIGSYFVLEMGTIYTFFREDLWSFPMFLLGLFGIFTGSFYVKLKSPHNLIPFLLGGIFAVFMFFQGWDYWIHRINFGTFTGKIAAFKLQQNIEGIDEKNNRITNKTLENKIVLLDFWHTKCGVCFQKFPQLQAFYNKYRNDDSIVIFAVDKPIEEDKEKSAFKVIEDEGYNFPVLLPTDEELPEKFGVFRFPVTFVLDRQGNVVYKGDIEGAIILVEDLKRQE